MVETEYPILAVSKPLLIKKSDNTRLNNTFVDLMKIDIDDCKKINNHTLKKYIWKSLDWWIPNKSSFSTDKLGLMLPVEAKRTDKFNVAKCHSYKEDIFKRILDVVKDSLKFYTSIKYMLDYGTIMHYRTSDVKKTTCTKIAFNEEKIYFNTTREECINCVLKDDNLGTNIISKQDVILLIIEKNPFFDTKNSIYTMGMNNLKEIRKKATLTTNISLFLFALSLIINYYY